jgi:hypothetical protein
MDTSSQKGPGPHLGPESWAALQRREPTAVAHFARHLQQPCEVCEAFLLHAPEGPGVDALEALADETLGAEAAPDAGEELGWARVRRELELPRPAAAPPPAQRRPQRRAWAARAVGLAAVAALALVVVRVGPWNDEAGGFRIKGQRPVALQLSAAAQLPDGRVVPVSDGAALPPEAVLLLRYSTEEATRALLVTQAAGRAPRVLGRFALQAGTHDLAEEGDLAGVSLEGEVGALTVALLAPAVPGAGLPEEGAALTAALDGESTESVVARLHVQVQAGHTPP